MEGWNLFPRSGMMASHCPLSSFQSSVVVVFPRRLAWVSQPSETSQLLSCWLKLIREKLALLLEKNKYIFSGLSAEVFVISVSKSDVYMGNFFITRTNKPRPRDKSPVPAVLKMSCRVKWETDLSWVIWAHGASVRNATACCQGKRRDDLVIIFFFLNENKANSGSQTCWFWPQCWPMLAVDYMLLFSDGPFQFLFNKGYRLGFYISKNKFLAIFSFQHTCKHSAHTETLAISLGQLGFLPFSDLALQM